MFVSVEDINTVFKSISNLLPIGSVYKRNNSRIILPSGVNIIVLNKLKDNTTTNLAGLELSQVIYYNCYEDDIDCHHWLVARLRSQCIGWNEMAKFANITIREDFTNIWRSKKLDLYLRRQKR